MYESSETEIKTCPRSIVNMAFIILYIYIYILILKYTILGMFPFLGEMLVSYQPVVMNANSG